MEIGGKESEGSSDVGKELENNDGEDCNSIDDGGMGDASDNAESGKAGRGRSVEGGVG
jgi:hypothetical protein